LLAAASLTAHRSEAHALLDYAEPPAGSELREAPSELVLHFAQALKPESSWILLSDAAGDDVPVSVTFDPLDRKLMRAALPASLGPGVYRVRWQTLSADDDDYAQGSYLLTVLNTDGSSPAGTNTTSGAKSNSGGRGRVVVILVVAGGVLILTGSLLLYRRRRGASV
jgi:methionine-rich copper-binding protein CopC